MRVFAMVSTKRSERYTAPALESFFRCTPLAADDVFVLIDNDQSLSPETLPRAASLRLTRNAQPLSFAANVNQVMRQAASAGADLFFLNNDLVFTPQWLDPLLLAQPVILSPLSNREVQYRKDDFSCERTLELEDYLGREPALLAINDFHRQKYRGYQLVMSLPFFCVKLPFAIYSQLGPLDERFGPGGAEDNDYCLRAALGGVRVAYASQSFVLHFNGKSTWSGAETPQETQQRDAKFKTVFRAKWGERLQRLLTDYDNSVLAERPEFHSALQQGDFKGVIQALLRLDGKLPG